MVKIGTETDIFWGHGLLEIKKIGSYLEVDERGYLKKAANVAKIREPWLTPVEAVSRAYLDKYGNNALHSIYIRGSVAKGRAIEGVSDIDSLAVLREGRFAEPEDTWEREVEEDLEARFPYVGGLEMICVPMEWATTWDNIYAFTIKVEAACIYGEDLASQIQGYKPGADAGFQMRHFRSHLHTFKREYPKRSEQERIRTVGWIMRRFLRLGMELVMEEEKRYTRDLYPCYESFAKHYPGKESEMDRALQLAINPIADQQAEDFTREFGDWLEAEADARLKKWGQTRSP